MVTALPTDWSLDVSRTFNLQNFYSIVTLPAEKNELNCQIHSRSGLAFRLFFSLLPLFALAVFTVYFNPLTLNFSTHQFLAPYTGGILGKPQVLQRRHLPDGLFLIGISRICVRALFPLCLLSVHLVSFGGFGGGVPSFSSALLCLCVLAAGCGG